MHLIPHTTQTRPCDRHDHVAYRLAGDPEIRIDRAGTLAWGAGAGPDGEGRIEGYCVVLPALAELDA